MISSPRLLDFRDLDNGRRPRLSDDHLGSKVPNDEITELACAGSIGPQAGVSQDQLNWTQARAVGGLTFPSAPPPGVPTQRSAGRQLAKWKLAASGDGCHASGTGRGAVQSRNPTR